MPRAFEYVHRKQPLTRTQILSALAPLQYAIFYQPARRIMEKSLVPAQHLEAAAHRFKLLSEPARLELLNQLQAHDEMAVNELVEATGYRQANVSKHLGLLADANLVARRKEGLYVYYRINDPTLSALCMLVCGRLREEAAAHKDTETTG